MIIYTAGPFKDREYVKEVAEKLRDNYYDVNSRWLDVSPDTPEGMTKEEYYRQQALNDLEDCIKANLLVYVNTGTMSEGKATELGVALAMLKPIIIVGPGGRSNNIFLHLNIPHYETVEQAVEWMKSEEMKAKLAKGVR
jgi:hypothetical protein